MYAISSNKYQKAFTLIELLVVITIITILSVVGLVSFQNVQKSAKDAKIKADLNAIKKAYEVNYDPSANGGQGGYIALAPSQFAGGQIPTQPNGSPYPCAVGPDSAPAGGSYGCTSQNSEGYQVSGTLSNNTTTSVISNQGTVPASQLNSCDPGAVLSNGLVGYWKMDEAQWNGTTNEVSDSSGNNNNGIAAGANTTSSGKFNSAGNFIATPANPQPSSHPIWTGTYVNVPHNSSQNLTTSFTISAWLYPTGSTAGHNNTYFTKGTLKLVLWSSNNYLQVRCLPAGNFQNIQLPSDQWTHLVITYDSSLNANNLKLYKNYNGSGAFIPYSSSGGASVASCIGTNPIQISNPGGVDGEPFGGRIDDMRVYNRALSGSEIQLLYSGCVQP